MENDRLVHELKSHTKVEMELIEKLVYQTRRKYFLEIGAYHFELSEYFISRLSHVKGGLISVDWKNQNSIRCSVLQTSSKDNFRFVLGNSMSLDTIARVKTIIGENEFDIVFIDGGHQYNIVKADTSNYADLVSDDGYIMWHDACSRIIPFIEELKKKECPIEILQDRRGLAYIKGDKWKEWKKSM